MAHEHLCKNPLHRKFNNSAYLPNTPRNGVELPVRADAPRPVLAAAPCSKEKKNGQAPKVACPFGDVIFSEEMRIKISANNIVNHIQIIIKYRLIR